MHPEPYRFPGIDRFVVNEGLRPSFTAKVTSSWLMGRLIDALTQASLAPPAHRAAMFAEARSVILAMHATTLTATAAFDEVFRLAPPPPTLDDPAPSGADPFAATRVKVEGAQISEPLLASVENGVLIGPGPGPGPDPRPRKAR